MISLNFVFVLIAFASIVYIDNVIANMKEIDFRYFQAESIEEEFEKKNTANEDLIDSFCEKDHAKFSQTEIDMIENQLDQLAVAVKQLKVKKVEKGFLSHFFQFTNPMQNINKLASEIGGEIQNLVMNYDIKNKAGLLRDSLIESDIMTQKREVNGKMVIILKALIRQLLYGDRFKLNVNISNWISGDHYKVLHNFFKKPTVENVKPEKELIHLFLKTKAGDDDPDIKDLLDFSAPGDFVHGQLSYSCSQLEERLKQYKQYDEVLGKTPSAIVVPPEDDSIIKFCEKWMAAI